MGKNYTTLKRSRHRVIGRGFCGGGDNEALEAAEVGRRIQKVVSLGKMMLRDAEILGKVLPY
jgi:hypothetical protein